MQCGKTVVIPQQLPSADLGPYMRTHIRTTAVGGRERVADQAMRTKNKESLSTYLEGTGEVLRPVEIITIYLHCPPHRALSLRATGCSKGD